MALLICHLACRSPAKPVGIIEPLVDRTRVALKSGSVLERDLVQEPGRLKSSVVMLDYHVGHLAGIAS